MAILGDSPVVCNAIAHLMQSGGYETRIVDTARCETVPPEADVVLVTAGTHSKARGSGRPVRDVVPVLRLVDTPEEKASLGESGILWPCPAAELHARFSCALAGSGSSRAPVLETPGEAGD